MNDPYVKKIAKQVRPDVKFKSTQNTSSQLKSPTNPKAKLVTIHFGQQLV